MKTRVKYARVTTPYHCNFGGYKFIVPVNSIVCNKTAMGANDDYRFLMNTNELAKQITGFNNTILAWDMEHKGVNIPAEYCSEWTNYTEVITIITRAKTNKTEIKNDFLVVV